MSSINASTSFPSFYTEIVEVDPSLRGYRAPAIARLGYLYPDLIFRMGEDGVAITAREPFDASSMRREVLHAVYRERIFTQTLSLRRTLIDGLLAR